MPERGREIWCYERVNSFRNLIEAICKSWQIEVEVSLISQIVSLIHFIAKTHQKKKCFRKKAKEGKILLFQNYLFIHHNNILPEGKLANEVLFLMSKVSQSYKKKKATNNMNLRWVIWSKGFTNDGWYIKSNKKWEALKLQIYLKNLKRKRSIPSGNWFLLLESNIRKNFRQLGKHWIIWIFFLQKCEFFCWCKL